MTIDEIDDLLNKRSGMTGLTGHNDMREVHRLIASGDVDARAGLDVYVHRLRKYIGAYAAVMGGIDALSFTAGVGENDPVVRAETAAGLGFLGIEIDPKRNAVRSQAPRLVSPDTSSVAVLVIPTDEEMAIALETMTLVGLQ
jgi:acetate kinase